MVELEFLEPDFLTPSPCSFVAASAMRHRHCDLPFGREKRLHVYKIECAERAPHCLSFHTQKDVMCTRECLQKGGQVDCGVPDCLPFCGSPAGKGHSLLLWTWLSRENSVWLPYTQMIILQLCFKKHNLLEVPSYLEQCQVLKLEKLNRSIKTVETLKWS